MRILALAFALFLSSCSTFNEKRDGRYLPEKITHLSKSSKPNGVAIVLHGLNVNPNNMSALVQLFQEKNYEVLWVRLSGHRGSMKEFQHVSHNAWINEVKTAYEQGRDLANKHKVPFIFVGYSLGGLLNLDFMSNHLKRPQAYDRMIMFAPALTLNWYAHGIRTLFLLHDTVLIPSLGPKDFNAHRKIPIAAYRALFQSFNAVYDNDFKYCNLKTLVFINDKDELVSARRLRYTLLDQDLYNWKLVQVDTSKSSLRERYNHIIINEPSVGAQEWAKIKEEIDNFLPQ